MTSILSDRPLILLADAGIPMIAVTWPLMLVMLLPVIFVESFVVSRRLAVPVKSVFKATAAANAFSTIFGIPLTWGLLLLFELALYSGLIRIPQFANFNPDSPIAEIIAAILTAPWIAPPEDSVLWAVPLATLVLLIPFFFASYWLEFGVTRLLLPLATGDELQSVEHSAKSLRVAVRDANLISYGFLFVGTTAWLI